MVVRYDSATSAGSSSSSSSSPNKLPPPPHHPYPDIDGLLAGAGYKVRHSDLRHVAQRLERLETAMVNSTAGVSQIASDAVHYNPTDLASWVDSLLSEFSHPPSDPADFVLDPSAMSADHRWERLCAENFPAVVSSLRSCFPTASYQQLYGIGFTASKRLPKAPTRPRISLTDLVFAVEVRSRSGAVLALTETADKFAGSIAFMFDIEVDSQRLEAAEAAEEVKVTWNVVLGPGMRAAFMMMESEGKANGWFSVELPAAGCGGDGGTRSGLVAEVKLGMGGAGRDQAKKVRLGIMNQSSLRYVGVDEALRYLQHFLLPSTSSK